MPAPALALLQSELNASPPVNGFELDLLADEKEGMDERPGLLDALDVGVVDEGTGTDVK